MNAEIDSFKDKIVSCRSQLLLAAQKYLGRREDAEDAVQEILLRLWQNRRELDSVKNPAGYAMRCLTNLCIDRLRAAREFLGENAIDGQISETPYSALEQKDAVALVGQIIDRLPELQRRIIRLRDVEGYELDEIAAITGTQVSAVTVNLSRARKKVREEFLRVNEFRKKV